MSLGLGIGLGHLFGLGLGLLAQRCCAIDPNPLHTEVVNVLDADFFEG